MKCRRTENPDKIRKLATVKHTIMKKSILSALALLLTLAVRAQADFETGTTVPATEAATLSPTERSEWLMPFGAVVIDATAEVRFVAVSAAEAPRIVYDTKGDYTTKFRAEVRDGVLRIRERADSHRLERTIVTVHYTALQSLTVTDAKVTFGNLLTASMFDLTIGARASFEAEIAVDDLAMELSGDSRATLSGKARYLTLTASTGQVDAAELECMSAVVSVKNKARVTIDATDRLEAKSATDGTIGYRREPNLLRATQSLLAGDIGRIE